MALCSLFGRKNTVKALALLALGALFALQPLHAHATPTTLCRIDPALFGRFQMLGESTIPIDNPSGWDQGATISVPADLQATVGYKSLKKKSKIGKGAMGFVSIVEGEKLDGTTEDLAWKEVKPTQVGKVEAVEYEGMLLQHFALQGAKASKSESDPEPPRILPVNRMLKLTHDDHHVIEGYLMPLAENTLRKAMYNGWDNRYRLKANLFGKFDPKTASAAIRDIAGIARDLFFALAELRETQTVHADIKPANIVLIKGRAYLIDFGLSSNQGWSFTSEVGTIPYLPTDNTLESDPAKDIYATAIALSEMLSGKEPDSRGGIPVSWLKKTFAYNYKQLRKEGVKKEDLALYSMLANFVVSALSGDREQRLANLVALDDSPIRVEPSGWVLGPSALLDRRIAESIAALETP